MISRKVHQPVVSFEKKKTASLKDLDLSLVDLSRKDVLWKTGPTMSQSGARRDYETSCLVTIGLTSSYEMKCRTPSIQAGVGVYSSRETLGKTVWRKYGYS